MGDNNDDENGELPSDGDINSFCLENDDLLYRSEAENELARPEAGNVVTHNGSGSDNQEGLTSSITKVRYDDVNVSFSDLVIKYYINKHKIESNKEDWNGRKEWRWKRRG